MNSLEEVKSWKQKIKRNERREMVTIHKAKEDFIKVKRKMHMNFSPLRRILIIVVTNFLGENFIKNPFLLIFLII